MQLEERTFFTFPQLTLPLIHESIEFEKLSNYQNIHLISIINIKYDNNNKHNSTKTPRSTGLAVEQHTKKPRTYTHTNTPNEDERLL